MNCFNLFLEESVLLNAKDYPSLRSGDVVEITSTDNISR